MTPTESGGGIAAQLPPDNLRQRRLRHHKIAALVITGLLIVVAPTWMYLRLMLCWSDMNTFFCSHAYLAPLLLILLAGVANVLTMFVLMGNGAELEARGTINRMPGLGVRRGIHRMNQSYRNLEPRPRADVRQTVFVFVIIWGALFAFLVWFFFEIPAGIALLVSMAFMIIAAAISRLMSGTRGN